MNMEGSHRGRWGVGGGGVERMQMCSVVAKGGAMGGNTTTHCLGRTGAEP